MSRLPKRSSRDMLRGTRFRDAMIPPRPTDLAQMMLRLAISPGDTVIDATAGNGHDTLALAQHVGAAGRVLAFDVQENAIRSARGRIQAAGLAERVEFHLRSHACIAEQAEGNSVSAVVFNLGYLPGDDHAVTTTCAETLAAMDGAALVLKPGGLLCMICYPGHAEGSHEAEAVRTRVFKLADLGWRTAGYEPLGTLRPAPFLLLACKPGGNRAAVTSCSS